MTSDAGQLPDVLPAARERVVERLTHHYANDELSEAAFEDLLQRVYAVTTARELDAIAASLPAAAAPAPAPPAVAPPAAAIAALFSGHQRQWVSVVPRELRVRARLGYVELDLRDATFEPGVTTIDARAFMGYVQIRLPPGVRVENEGRALFGFFALKGSGAPHAQAAPPVASVVRITGRAVFGFAEGVIDRP
jgi:hypothetical protein